MHTLGFNFRPWNSEKAIADGPSIRDYIRETAAVYGIDKKIRFGHRVVAAALVDSPDATWTLEVDAGGRAARFTCNFLYCCSGYYDYAGGYMPGWPGMESFRGTIVHPQKWPENLDYTGKRVVVIGSGATAVTLVPAMADEGRARHDAAALADLHHHAAGRRRDRQSPVQFAAAANRRRDRQAGRTSRASSTTTA